MNYQNIVFECTGGVARLVLNRPDRLNSFNSAMHLEVRDALASLIGDSGALGAGHHGGGTWVPRRPGSCGPCRGTGKYCRGSGESIEKNYKPLFWPCGRYRSCHRRRQWSRGGRGRQYRSGSRSRDRRVLGDLCAGVLEEVGRFPIQAVRGPAAPGRHGAGDGPCTARREAAGPPGGRMGPDLAMRGRCRAAVGGARISPPPRSRAHPGARADEAGHSTKAGGVRSSSLTWSVTISANRERTEDYAEGVAAFSAKRTPRSIRPLRIAND